MALARVHTWNAGEVLTASDLNAEFNNIINNTTLLISPLTSNLDLAGFSLQSLARGSVSSPGLYFTGDTNTGLWSPGADQVSLSAGGATAFSVVSRVAGTAYMELARTAALGERFYPPIAFGQADDGVMSVSAGTIDLVAAGRRVLQASAYANATNYVRVSSRDTGAGPLIDVAGADTDIDLNLASKGAGLIRAATAFIPAAWANPGNAPPQHGLMRENVVKGYAAIGGAAGASLYASFNVSSVTRNGAGNWTITWLRPFKQASAYAVIGTGTSDPGDGNSVVVQVAKTASTVNVLHLTISAGTPVDAVYTDVIAMGDQ